MVLFDLLLGFVAVASDYGVFERFVLFVLHLEGMAFIVDQQDFDLAVGAIVFVVRWAIGEDVLVADGVVDLGEDVREFALKDWTEAHAARHGSEGL